MSVIAKALSESGKRVRPPRKPKATDATSQSQETTTTEPSGLLGDTGAAKPGVAVSRFGAVAKKAKTYTEDEQAPDNEDSPPVTATAPVATVVPEKAPAPRFKVSAAKEPARAAVSKPAGQPVQPTPVAESVVLRPSVSSVVQPTVPTVVEQGTQPAGTPARITPADDLSFLLTQDDIPEGSAFTLEQWNKAQESCHPEKIIYELRDSTGSRFANMPIYRGNPLNDDEMDDLESRMFNRSLMVTHALHCELAEQGAQRQTIHCVYNFKEWSWKECPRLTFMVTRTKTSMRLAPNCPIWNSMPKDLGMSEVERERSTQKQKNTGLDGSGRFGGAKPQPQTQRPRG